MIRASDEEARQTLLQENRWWEELAGILPPRFQAVKSRLILPDFHRNHQSRLETVSQKRTIPQQGGGHFIPALNRNVQLRELSPSSP